MFGEAPSATAPTAVPRHRQPQHEQQQQQQSTQRAESDGVTVVSATTCASSAESDGASSWPRLQVHRHHSNLSSLRAVPREERRDDPLACGKSQRYLQQPLRPLRRRARSSPSPVPVLATPTPSRHRRCRSESCVSASARPASATPGDVNVSSVTAPGDDEDDGVSVAAKAASTAGADMRSHGDTSTRGEGPLRVSGTERRGSATAAIGVPRAKRPRRPASPVAHANSALLERAAEEEAPCRPRFLSTSSTPPPPPQRRHPRPPPSPTPPPLRVPLAVSAAAARAGPTSPRARRLHTTRLTEDMPESLARLLRQYLAQSPPKPPPPPARSPPAAGGTVVDRHAWTRFLAVRWGGAALPDEPPPPPSAPPSPQRADGKRRRTEEEEDAGDAETRAPAACGAGALGSVVPGSASATRAPLSRLWRLLRHYPHDVSACLALSLGVCIALDAMRAVPPPMLPDAALQQIALSTSTDAHAFAAAHAEAWVRYSTQVQTRRGAGAAAHAAADSSNPSTSPHPATCACGCLVVGQLLDPHRYRFHLLYYRYHGRSTPAPLPAAASTAEAVAAQDTRDVAPPTVWREELPGGVGGTVVAASRLAAEQAVLVEGARLRPSLPASLAAPPTQPARPPHQQSSTLAPPQDESDLPCPHTGPSPVSLLPLLAVQTLADFIVASSARRGAALARQQQRWERRRGRRRSTGPAELSVNAACRHGVAAVVGDEVDDPLRGYAGFCSEAERLWVVLACVWMAWKQLEQCVSLAFLVPRLEVLWTGGRAGDTATAPRNSAFRGTSALTRAADAVRRSPDELRRLLLATASDAPAACPFPPRLPSRRSGSGSGSGGHPHTSVLTQHVWQGAAAWERGVLQQLRTRLLEQEPREFRADAADELSADLVAMESFVHASLKGRVGWLPLWGAVAVEVSELYTEQRRSDSAMLAQLRRPPQHRTRVEAQSAWLLAGRVQQVVLLATRLLSLPCAAAAATASARPGVTEEERQRQRQWQRIEREGRSPLCDAEGYHEADGGDGNRDVGDSDAGADAAVPAVRSADTLARLGAYMTWHPLFGVAVAVVAGAVPLWWAAGCVAPCAAAAASSDAAAVVSAADSEAQAELRRVVEQLYAWLREAEGRA